MWPMVPLLVQRTVSPAEMVKASGLKNPTHGLGLPSHWSSSPIETWWVVGARVVLVVEDVVVEDVDVEVVGGEVVVVLEGEEAFVVVDDAPGVEVAVVEDAAVEVVEPALGTVVDVTSVDSVVAGLAGVVLVPRGPAVVDPGRSVVEVPSSAIPSRSFDPQAAAMRATASSRANSLGREDRVFMGPPFPPGIPIAITTDPDPDWFAGI